MWQSLLWGLLFMLARLVLRVGKDFVTKAIEAANTANGLTHEDGTPYSGAEKYGYVFEALVAYAKQYSIDLGDSEKSTINALIELAVNYLKSKTVA